MAFGAIEGVLPLIQQGRLRPLAVTVGMALLTSLALALTWTPTLSHFFIRRRSRDDAVGEHPAPGTEHPALSTQHPAPEVCLSRSRGRL